MRNIKSILADKIASISPKLFFSLAYLHNRHRVLKLGKNKDLSALWIDQVLSGKIEDRYSLADKYEVRSVVESKGLAHILPKLLGVYDDPKDIPFEALPDKYAIKLNYGAGMNIICCNKRYIDTSIVTQQLKEWLNRGKYNLAEKHYNKIRRRILVEEFIEDGMGGFPIDFKFICLNGEVKCCLVCSGRESGHTDYIPYDLHWQPKFDWVKNAPDITSVKLYPKPANLQRMIEIAETLSKNLDMVRVDLYSDGNKVWFGEMTLTPAGCIFHRWSNKAMDELGKMYKRTIKR